MAKNEKYKMGDIVTVTTPDGKTLSGNVLAVYDAADLADVRYDLQLPSGGQVLGHAAHRG